MMVFIDENVHLFLWRYIFFVFYFFLSTEISEAHLFLSFLSTEIFERYIIVEIRTFDSLRFVQSSQDLRSRDRETE